MTEEDKGAYRYCKNCGRVLSPTYEAELCPTCEENQLFDKVRDYIRKNDVTEHAGSRTILESRKRK